MPLPTVAPVPLRVVVVGAGPVGLCAATALRQDGHNVTVLERRPGVEPRGHALVIQPAAVRALGHLRAAHEAFRDMSVPSGRQHLWSYRASEPFAISATRPKHHQVPAEERRFQTDRPSVQTIFHKLAAASGVRLIFGKTAQSIQDDSVGARLLTGDGDEFKADLIIAADGIKSGIRRLLFPSQNVDPIPLRESIFLTSAPISRLRQDARLAPWLEIGSKHAILGPDRFILTRHVFGDRLTVQFMDVDHAEPGPVDGNWNVPADIGMLQRRFSDFSNPVTKAYLKHVSQAERWQMAVGPDIATWRSAKGRVVLIGDAAHAMLPHTGQGLSQGIEDAVSLAHILRLADVSSATQAWVGLRKPRADVFMKQALDNAKLWTLPDGPKQVARDERMAAAITRLPPDFTGVEMDMNADRSSPQFLKWVRAYDVVSEMSRYR